MAQWGYPLLRKMLQDNDFFHSTGFKERQKEQKRPAMAIKTILLPAVVSICGILALAAVASASTQSEASPEARRVSDQDLPRFMGPLEPAVVFFFIINLIVALKGIQEVT